MAYNLWYMYGKYTMKGEKGKIKCQKASRFFGTILLHTVPITKGNSPLVTVKIHIHRPYDPIFATTASKKTATSSWICLLGVI